METEDRRQYADCPEAGCLVIQLLRKDVVGIKDDFNCGRAEFAALSGKVQKIHDDVLEIKTINQTIEKIQKGSSKKQNSSVFVSLCAAIVAVSMLIIKFT